MVSVKENGHRSPSCDDSGEQLMKCILNEKLVAKAAIKWKAKIDGGVPETWELAASRFYWMHGQCKDQSHLNSDGMLKGPRGICAVTVGISQDTERYSYTELVNAL